MRLKSGYHVWNGTLINATASDTSGAMDLTLCESVTEVFLKAVSATGDADVKLEYAVSPDGTNFGLFTDNAPLVTSSATEFPAISKEGWMRIILPPIDAPWIKLKCTGTASNPTDTYIYAYLDFIEDVACSQGGRG